jgi:hypothetical protein
MRFTRRQYTLREMLAAITVAVCVAAVASWAYRIHKAATYVESNGGDVWCSGRIYSGSDFGGPPISATRSLWLRAAIVGRIMCGTHTDLWVCFVPGDRERFAESIELLNPRMITFEVLGPKDLEWVRGRKPGVEIAAFDGLQKEPAQPPIVRKDKEIPNSGRPSPADVARILAELDRMRAENPQSSYRLDRYETVIGFPPSGAMGMIYDKHTGRTIVLPWPH